MILIILLFLCGFTLSGISAVYSIIGLLSIFPSAPYTIGIMTGALEVSKLVIASWMYRQWKDIPFFLRLYFVIALIVLMFLTSMACFGALSKAHSESAVTIGASVSALNIVDEKIATQKENIKVAKNAITQLDLQVDQMLVRTTDDKGTNRAVSIRNNQKKERLGLAIEISSAQTEITKLQIERAPLTAAMRQIQADIGPVKYIANLVYGDVIDDTILEKAVRMVILMIVFVFDPLAVLLLIAANWQLKHHEKIRTTVTSRHIETVEDITTSNTEEFPVANETVSGLSEYLPDEILQPVDYEPIKLNPIPKEKLDAFINKSAPKCSDQSETSTKVHQSVQTDNEGAYTSIIPSTEELQEKYKDVFENESSIWTDDSLLQTPLSLVDSAAAVMSKQPVEGVKNLVNIHDEFGEEFLTQAEVNALMTGVRDEVDEPTDLVVFPTPEVLREHSKPLLDIVPKGKEWSDESMSLEQQMADKIAEYDVNGELINYNFNDAYETYTADSVAAKVVKEFFHPHDQEDNQHEEKINDVLHDEQATAIDAVPIPVADKILAAEKSIVIGSNLDVTDADVFISKE